MNKTTLRVIVSILGVIFLPVTLLFIIGYLIYLSIEDDFF